MEHTNVHTNAVEVMSTNSSTANVQYIKKKLNIWGLSGKYPAILNILITGRMALM